MPDPTFQVLASGSPLRLSPTNLSEFIRLEQCERYLRLRLFHHLRGQGLLYEDGVRPQARPALLTRSGRRFEERVEVAVRSRFSVVNFAEGRDARSRGPDHERLLEAIRAL